jgi:hypothetical protein
MYLAYKGVRSGFGHEITKLTLCYSEAKQELGLA